MTCEKPEGDKRDELSIALLDDLFAGKPAGDVNSEETSDMLKLYEAASSGNRTAPIVELFERLRRMRLHRGLSPQAVQLGREGLDALCRKHRELDEHGVTVGGRVGRARNIASEACQRVADYLACRDSGAASGIELWDRIVEHQVKIRKALDMSESDWNSFSGQMSYAVEDAATLARCVDLSGEAVRDIERVTATYRMRLTPYYASLIMDRDPDDPVLLQAVPTPDMVDNLGEEIPPVAADHSPARLVDQFYPRVVAVKATNMCAMYCTHCLRLAHIGNKDRMFSREAYEEALAYIRGHESIRDVLLTGGDALMLSNDMLCWLLSELDAIDHVRVKRVGSRIPVTAPQRVDRELLDIMAESNERGPLRFVTQINTAREVTPVSRDVFRRISGCVSAVLNQAVLLRKVNDSKHRMWKLCETIQEAYIRPYYVFNCSYRNPQFSHRRVPIERGRDIVESMYGNLSGDAIPRYIAAAGGKIPLHRENVVRREGRNIVLRRPWDGSETAYPDA